MATAAARLGLRPRSRLGLGLALDLLLESALRLGLRVQ